MRFSTILILIGIGCLWLLPTSAFGLPDAVVERIVAEGGDLRAGDRLPLTVHISNRGPEPLPAVPVALMVDGVAVTDTRLGEALAPGEITTGSLTWTATRGAHVIAARVDPLNDIPESDERNNIAYISLGVEAAPEPSPWPPILAGGAAFGVGGLAAFLARRSMLPPQPHADKQKHRSSNRSGGCIPPTER